MKNSSVKTMVQLALLIAVEIVMKMIGLGSVPVGPLYMSFLTVPIAVGAIVLGPIQGAILGGVFGLVSFKDALTGASVMTSTLLAVSPVKTFILCVVTRVLMGLCVGLIYKGLKAVMQNNARYVLGAICAPLLNTLFFMGWICLAFWNTDYVQGLCSTLNVDNAILFVAALVGVQGLIEAAVCAIVGGACSKGVDIVVNKQ